MEAVDLGALSAAIIDGDASQTKDLVAAAVARGVPPEDIVSGWMIPAMAEVGARFERQEYFVPEMLVSARAMQMGLALLRPLLALRDVKPVATVVLGTVKGDLHDIGKNLVAMMLEGAGFEVVDLGVDVPTERFIQAAKERRATVIGLSALLTTTMPQMEAVVRAVTAAGLRDGIKILVGGAPVTPRFAAQIGADGYGETAAAAVRVAREVLSAATTES